MYGPLRPVVYTAMCSRLEDFDIIAYAGPPEKGCHILRQMKMGVGTSVYYSFPYEGEGMMVPEPMLGGVLDFFGISHDLFMAGLVGQVAE